MFYVIREAGFDIGFRPEPYVGSVPIVSRARLLKISPFTLRNPNRYRQRFCLACC